MKASVSEQYITMSSSMASSLISIGLFLGTIAVCQLIPNKTSRRFKDDQDDPDEDSASDLEEVRQWYKTRRLYGRLSYQNMEQAMNASDERKAVPVIKPVNFGDDGLPGSQFQGPPPLAEVRQADMFQSRRSMTMIPDANPDYHPNADYDFHPKNRNWSHFEHFNESDRQQREALHQTSLNRFSFGDTLHNTSYDLQEGVSDAVKEQNKTNGESDMDGSASVSSEDSKSSDEDFVWTTSIRKRTNVEDYEDEKGVDSWPIALTKRFHAAMKSPPPPPSRKYGRRRPDRGTASQLRVQSDRAAMSGPGSAPINGTGQRGFGRNVSSMSSGVDGSGSSRNETFPRSGNFPPPLDRLSRRSLSSPNLIATSRNFVGKLLSFSTDSSVQDDGGSNMSVTNHDMRAKYNAKIMPEKLVMIRHGQSMGNTDETLYSTIPDNAMPLTKLGWQQAREAGRALKEKVLTSGETVHFIVSPYVRTVETFHGIVSAWCDPKDFSHIKNRDKRVKAWYGKLMEMGISWNEDPRIREQDFGNYQVPAKIRQAKSERHRFGVFYYRFPDGESASDVFDRVSIFLDSLWRSFEMNRARNYILVTHGISIRVFLARYFRYTIDQFNMLANPRNCEMVVLGHNGEGRLELDGRCQIECQKDPETEEDVVVGHRFHKRLRILPNAEIRRIKMRVSEDDDLD